MGEDILVLAKNKLAQGYTAIPEEIVKELIAEVERLRSENRIISDRAAHNAEQDAAMAELQAARIKELGRMCRCSGSCWRRRSGMHRGALAALVERGLNSVCLGKIKAGPLPLGMPQKVVQRLKSEGIILRAHEYHKDHYFWRPGPKYDHFLAQLVAMEDRCHQKK